MQNSFDHSRYLLNKLTFFVVLVIVINFIFVSPVWAKNHYKKQVKKWTRNEEVYGREDFYASMKWNVTFFSSEYIEAKVEKLTEIYKYDEKKQKELLRHEQEKIDKYYVFFVSFYAYDYKHADLSDKDSIWNLTLNVDGKEKKPEKIKKISRLTPVHRALYPYINVWSRYFLVFFPKERKTTLQEFNLEIRGPFGHSSLVWN